MGVMYGSSIALLLLSSSALLFLGGTPLVLEHVGSLVLLQFLSLLLLMACYGRILQTQEYHLFADSRALSCSCATLPNSCDVLVPLFRTATHTNNRQLPLLVPQINAHNTKNYLHFYDNLQSTKIPLIT